MKQRLYLLLLFANLCYGWTGRKRAPAETPVQPRGRILTESKEPWIEVLSWHPRAFLYHNFLIDGEADHLVRLAKPLMKRSTVVGIDGHSVQDEIRTSYGCFLPRHGDEIITKIEQRLAIWSKLNISHQEDIQILRYVAGQKYGAHYDVLEEGSKRVATAITYLSDAEEGGETAFTSGSKWVDPSLEDRLGPFSECAAGHVAAKPRKGDALLFFSIENDGVHQDPASMHTGCPIIKGVKWTATFWIHAQPFRPNDLEQAAVLPSPPQPELCENFHPECDQWAEDGECERNEGYMSGDNFSIGQCRLACKACEPCGQTDIECMKRNRETAGYLPLDAI